MGNGPALPYNPPMTVSSSTPRIRLTQALFVLVLAAVALSGGRAFGGPGGLLAQAAGFLLVACGTLWRLWASVFIAGRKDVEVVDIGPYARCRHPLYLGSLAAGLGLALSTRSLVLTLALPATLAVFHWLAVRREERFLAERHGAAWEAYRARVPAFWPRSGRSPALPRREVDLAVYRKAFLDAATMLGVWGMIVALDALRMQGAWRDWFVLP
jgi:protein-S-isoprenylcysteine O-methyltransferase Ste14